MYESKTHHSRHREQKFPKPKDLPGRLPGVAAEEGEEEKGDEGERGWAEGVVPEGGEEGARRQYRRGRKGGGRAKGWGRRREEVRWGMRRRKDPEREKPGGGADQRTCGLREVGGREQELHAHH